MIYKHVPGKLFLQSNTCDSFESRYFVNKEIPTKHMDEYEQHMCAREKMELNTCVRYLAWIFPVWMQN